MKNPICKKLPYAYMPKEYKKKAELRKAYMLGIRDALRWANKQMDSYILDDYEYK